jgi:hypothetical protein
LAIPRSDLVVLGGIVAVAALLRFSALGHQSLWFDEWLTSLHMTGDPIAMLKSVKTHEVIPPLYFSLLWVWTKFFGVGETGLRSLSAMFGTLTVPVVYLCARVLHASRRGALVAAALVAVHPLLVWYSQEARAYALLVFLGALAFLFWAYALQQPTRWALAGWGISSALMFATHYTGAVLIVPAAVGLFVVLHDRRRDVVLASLPIAVVALGLLPLRLQQHASTQFISEIPLPRRLGGLVREFLTGIKPFDDWVWVPALALVLVAALLAALRTDRLERRGVALAASLGAAAVAFPIAMALAGVDYVVSRYVIVAVVPLLVAGGIACGSRRAGRLGMAVAAAACTLLAAVVLVSPSNSARDKPSWRAVAEALGPAREDRVIFAPGYSSMALRYYLGSARELVPGRTVKVSEVAVLGFDPPRATATDPCWTGILCNLPQATVPRLPPAPSFRRVDETRRGRFTVVRFRAPARAPVRVGAVAGWHLPKAIAIIQRAHTGR